ncbi:MAG: hypothetical protein WC971_04150 [Coriobacteriia bacterium]
MMRRAALIGMMVFLALAAGCSPSIESLNAKAKKAQSYDSPKAVYDAMTAGGVEATAFIDKGPAAGPAGTTMYSSGDVNLGGGFATILVFPRSAVSTMDSYVTSWLSSAKSAGVKDPTVLKGADWLLTGDGDLSKVQEALGGKLQK